MATARRTIFRNKALQYYAQSQERDVLPRFVAPPIFVFLWILLGLLLAATVAAWLGQVPTYVAGSGIVLNQESKTQQGSSEAVAVVFLPAPLNLHLSVGLPVQVQIGSTGTQVFGTINTVEPGVLSPDAARTRYALSGNLEMVITQPSLAVTVGLGTVISAQTYAGSIVSAQVQVGTQRVLSLLPIVGQWIGD
jgi:hypothetical protein